MLSLLSVKFSPLFFGMFKEIVSIIRVIFHQLVRVFYQGLQTRENNENHEAVNQVIFIVLKCF